VPATKGIARRIDKPLRNKTLFGVVKLIGQESSSGHAVRRIVYLIGGSYSNMRTYDNRVRKFCPADVADVIDNFSRFVVE
jgi:hypothetical protein